MAKQSSDHEITADDLRGFKQLRRVAGLLSALHEAGCGRDKAGNRELHFDDYVLLILLYLFNPLIDSMRMLQKVAELPEVRRRLGIKRFSLGSFSESCRVFDPQMLQQVVQQLAGELQPVERHALLRQLPGRLTLVDSTVIQTLCTVAEAIYLPLQRNDKHSHAWRLHLQFDVDHHVPSQWEVTPPRNTGTSEEKHVLRRKLAADHTYVMDRWYAQFTLWNDIRSAGSSYVCRVRDNSVYDVLEERTLDQAAIEAGIISDQVVEIGLSKKPHQRANHPTRLICIKCTPHRKRGMRSNGESHGPTSDGTLRIVTDLLDVPAHVIAFLYEYRWTIEVFFRFVKQILGCRHLLSTRPQGVQIQIYAAVICCLMLNTLTGRKPTKWMVTLMALYLQGLASDDDVLRELNKPDNTGLKLRAKDELWKKLGVN